MVAHCFRAPLRPSVSLRHHGNVSLLFVLPLTRSANVYRSLLCIIKTLEQIFILFAIQLDRQFPGRLRKYLLSCGASLGLNSTTLGHFPHYRITTSREDTYLEEVGTPRGHVLVTIYLTHRCYFIILNFNLCFMQ